MNWFEIYKGNGYWDVYKVTGNGTCYSMYKRFKTESGARNFARKHWVRRWTGD